jgi:hypothetical protein
VKNSQELIMPTAVEKSSPATPELKDARLFREGSKYGMGEFVEIKSPCFGGITP